MLALISHTPLHERLSLLQPGHDCIALPDRLLLLLRSGFQPCRAVSVVSIILSLAVIRHFLLASSTARLFLQATLTFTHRPDDIRFLSYHENGRRSTTAAEGSPDTNPTLHAQREILRCSRRRPTAREQYRSTFT